MRSKGPTAPAWSRQASATTVAVATMQARNSAIQARRRPRRGSHSQSAASIAGRVGNISRHSNSQPIEEQYRDRGDPCRRRPREPDRAQRHRREHHRVARHDVLVHDGEEHHVAGREVERARQPGDDPVARQRTGEQVGHPGAEARAHGIQDGELASRIAGEDIQEVEQAAEEAVDRVEEIVGGVERGVRRIDHPGFQLEALEDAIARQSALRIVEPQDEGDQHGAAADDEQRKIDERAARCVVVAQGIGGSQKRHGDGRRLRPRRLRQGRRARTIASDNRNGRMSCIV